MLISILDWRLQATAHGLNPAHNLDFVSLEVRVVFPVFKRLKEDTTRLWRLFVQHKTSNTVCLFTEHAERFLIVQYITYV